MTAAGRAGGWCAIDFGTSNSAVALPTGVLAPLEGAATTMPTAVFYFAEGAHDADGPPRAFGRAALAAYVDGEDGRLMRSMKSLLGSALLDRHTEVGSGRSVRYADMLVGYLKRLRTRAGEALGQPPTRAVLGRPVRFVDDDDARDAAAQQALQAAAHAAGFADVAFQFEPIAAAFDFEQRVARETQVLVADIGGGTSDFSLVRVGPAQRARLERQSDILAHHGVHTAGTDFDRQLALATTLRELGLGSHGPARAGGGAPRPVPSGIYFDLATWHLINTAYAPASVAEWRRRGSDFADARHHQRLMRVLTARLGHHLAALIEAGKIAVSEGGRTVLDLAAVEPGLALALDAATAQAALHADVGRIVAAAQETVRRAGLAPAAVQALYLTGGSTGYAPLADALHAAFPAAQRVQGERFASVATGLGLDAARRFRD